MRILLASALVASTAVAVAADPAAAFRALCAERADAGGAMTVVGEDGWLFLAKELRHIGVGEFWGARAAEVSQAKPDVADPLPVIVDVKDQLAALGIELVVMPVPPKAIVYPDRLDPSITVDGVQPVLDQVHRRFYAELEARGVRVLNLADVFRAQRGTDDDPIYCRTDTHWSGRACVLAARLLAEDIEQRPWYAGTPRRDLQAETRTVSISGDLLRGLPDGHGVGPEDLPLRFVTENGQPVAPDDHGPVLLLGDSHTLVFHLGGDMHARGAGLADQLAYELGFPVALVGVKGSGATPARITLFRKGRRDPQLIDSKKLVIWCFTAREFTESSGWRQVPVKK